MICLRGLGILHIYALKTYSIPTQGPHGPLRPPSSCSVLLAYAVLTRSLRGGPGGPATGSLAMSASSSAMWSLCGLSVVSLWSVCGLSVASVCSLCGLSVLSICSLCALSVVSLCSLCGLSVLSLCSLSALSVVSHLAHKCNRYTLRAHRHQDSMIHSSNRSLTISRKCDSYKD